MTSKHIKVATCGMAMLDTVCAGLEREPDQGEHEWPDIDIGDNPAGHPIDVAICLTELGHPAEDIGVIASVGKDFAGDMFINELAEHGIDTRYIKRSNRKTGRNVITVVKGEDRRFRPSQGANKDLDLEFVLNAFNKLQPDIVSIRPGYSAMDYEIAVVLQSLPPECFILLDLMKPKPRKGKDEKDRTPFIREAFQYAHAVHCNEGEAMFMTGTQDLDSAVRYFLRAGVWLVLITSGSKGVRVVTKTGFDIRQPGFQVDVIDPTGCGDAFCAGFIWGLINRFLFTNFSGLENDFIALSAILKDAQAAGAAVAEGLGTIAGISAERVRQLVREQGNQIISQTQVQRFVLGR